MVRKGGDWCRVRVCTGYMLLGKMVSRGCRVSQRWDGDCRGFLCPGKGAQWCLVSGKWESWGGETRDSWEWMTLRSSV